MYGSSSGAQIVTIVEGGRGPAVVVERWLLDLPGESLSWAVNCSSSERRITIFILRPMPACG